MRPITITFETEQNNEQLNQRSQIATKGGYSYVLPLNTMSIDETLQAFPGATDARWWNSETDNLVCLNGRSNHQISGINSQDIKTLLNMELPPTYSQDDVWCEFDCSLPGDFEYVVGIHDNRDKEYYPGRLLAIQRYLESLGCSTAFSDNDLDFLLMVGTNHIIRRGTALRINDVFLSKLAEVGLR